MPQDQADKANARPKTVVPTPTSGALFFSCLSANLACSRIPVYFLIRCSTPPSSRKSPIFAARRHMFLDDLFGFVSAFAKERRGLIRNCRWQFLNLASPQKPEQGARHPMPTNTICFINQKGGCGKSSSCFHLAGHFASRGLRVLAIDADPQGSLSQGFFGSATVEQLSSRETLAAIFNEDEMASPELLVMPTPIERISVIRANAQLAKHNVPEPENAGMKQFALASFLETVPGFDLILMDCPPNLYLCSWNAMLASNFVVIP